MSSSRISVPVAGPPPPSPPYLPTHPPEKDASGSLLYIFISSFCRLRVDWCYVSGLDCLDLFLTSPPAPAPPPAPPPRPQCTTPTLAPNGASGTIR